MAATNGVIAFTGAVLAGGASSRMGVDKATLPWDGLPLWQRQLSVLAAAGASSVAVVRSPAQAPLAPDVAHLRDQHVGVGPLGGIHAALTHSDQPLTAVLAVDMPCIDPAWYAWLSGHCREQRGAVVVIGGRYEPLAALYPKSALPLLERRLAIGLHSAQALLADLEQERQMISIRLPGRARWRLRNCNAPSDLPALAVPDPDGTPPSAEQVGAG